MVSILPVHEWPLLAVRMSDRNYRIPVPALERFVSTQPERTFEIAYSRVNRLKKLGESIATPPDDLIVV